MRISEMRWNVAVQFIKNIFAEKFLSKVQHFLLSSQLFRKILAILCQSQQ